MLVFVQIKLHVSGTVHIFTKSSYGFLTIRYNSVESKLLCTDISQINRIKKQLNSIIIVLNLRKCKVYINMEKNLKKIIFKTIFAYKN